MSDRKITIIIYRNKFGQWVSSTTTLAMVIGISVANHRFGGASTWVDALAVVLGFTVILGLSASVMKLNQFRGSVDDAIEYLKSLQ